MRLLDGDKQTVDVQTGRKWLSEYSDFDAARGQWRDTRGDSADTDLGNEFDADPCFWIHVFKVVNQLREILD